MPKMNNKGNENEKNPHISEKEEEPHLSPKLANINQLESRNSKNVCDLVANENSKPNCLSLKRKLLQRDENFDSAKEKSTVDEMFKDYLMSRMLQIEKDYQEKNAGFGFKNNDLSSSVQEMSKVLDAELSDMSSKFCKNDDQESSAGKSQAIEWEFLEPKKHGKSKNVVISSNVKEIQGQGATKCNILKLDLKITDTSSLLISSGQTEKKKRNDLEQGEISSNSDKSSGKEEASDCVSETGSLSEQEDKETSKSKSKKKKLKKSKKHKKKKKKHKPRHSSSSPKRSKEKSPKTQSHKYGKEEDRGFDAYAYRSGRSMSRSRERYRRNDRSGRRSSYERHEYRSRSRSPEPSKQKAMPCRRSRERSSSVSRYEEDRGFDAYNYRQGRSRSKDRYYHGDRLSRSSFERLKYRSRSQSPDSSKEMKIDKSKLRQIAIKNALAMAKNGQGPSLNVPTLKAGGKSVGELTDFCKRISSKDNTDHSYFSSSESEKEEPEENVFILHPFKLKDNSQIVLNIKNSKPLPLKTPQEKIAAGAVLSQQFPVSSGSTHRMKESEWVPVEKNVTKVEDKSSKLEVEKATDVPPSNSNTPTQSIPVVAPIPADKVFPDPPTQAIDISSVISERIQAVRKLQENPNDYGALSSIAESQEKASLWASSKNLPGQFIGSTGATILSQDELIGCDKRQQAWARKDQFVNLAPLQSGVGMALLEKMGWKRGTGLGKNNEGTLEPLALDVKHDRRGLTTQEEIVKRPNKVTAIKGSSTLPKDLSGKHPVSALVELCNKRKWGPPIFELVHESGPDHKKNFLFKVTVNRTAYQPSVTSNNKKHAKAAAAAVCLTEFGLIMNSSNF